ncbi:MAG: type II secretion system F family protein [Acidobacteria bacterium]|nr:type II secretion system F family protein [Acidobacteriota bacterium]
MAELTIYTLAFLFTFVITSLSAAIAWTFVERRASAENEPPGRLVRYSLLRSEALSTMSTYNVILSRVRFVPKLKELLEHANVEWSVGRVSLMMLLAGVVVLNVAIRSNLLPLLGSFMLAGVAAASPIFYLINLRTKRYRAVEEQLPEALDYLSRAVIAGNSLPMSMELMADEVGPPLSTEVRKIVDEYNLGSPMDEALHGFAERLPLVDVRFFVSAVLTQSRTGGNLHELLDTLSETIRERAALKGQVRALTANGRLTALILTALPILIAATMWFVNPAYFMVLADHPLGKTLIFAAICAQVTAYFVINKIVDIKV